MTALPRRQDRIGGAGYDPRWDQIRDDGIGGYYDRAGNPISLRQWAELTERWEGKRVAEASVTAKGGQRLWISTVWLGIDHGFGFSSAPVIFETMVFNATDDGGSNPRDLGMDRYCHETEAFRGHDEMVGRYAQDWWLDLGGRA